MDMDLQSIRVMWDLKSCGLLLVGLLVGAIAGVALTQLSRKPAEPRHEVRYNQYPDYDPQPEQMLYPDGTRLETLYPDERFLAAIRSPETISIHPIGGDGKVVLDKYRFSSQGATPTKETATRLVHALCSISSYEPPGKACVFDPRVLLRLTKGGVTYDMMFCFSCRQIGASHVGGADMTPQGLEVFLKCFCDTLPNFKELHEFRRQSTLRRKGIPVREKP